MKTFEVTIDKPSTMKDWCPYDEKVVFVKIPYTVAILTARNQEHLMEKIKKYYAGFNVQRIREINL